MYEKPFDSVDQATDDPTSVDPIERGDVETAQAVANRIEEISPSDGANELEKLSVTHAAEVAAVLDPETAGRILARMHAATAAGIITAMLPPEASMVLSAIDPDDRVDILEHVSGLLHEELMREFSPQDAADVRNLEQYPPDTAGGIMTTQVTSLPEDMTVEAGDCRTAPAQGRTGPDVLCVCGRQPHAPGGCAVDARSDFIAAATAVEPDHAPQRHQRAGHHGPGEEVARITRKYKYLAMPVVDARNRLIGLITVDDVIDVIGEEATEDLQRMFGAAVLKNDCSAPGNSVLRNGSGGWK